MKWDRAMTQVLSLVLITSQILMTKEVSMIGPVNDTDQPVKINGASSERQQWIDERRLTSTVDSVPPHDIPPDRITSKRVKLNDKRKEQDTEDNPGRDSRNSEYLDQWIYYVDHYMSDYFKKRDTDYATKFDTRNKQLGRIVQGTPYQIERVPYLVQVMFYGSHVCGGTLISYTHVLSAAHCFVEHDLKKKWLKVHDSESYDIRYGATHRNIGGDVIQVASLFIHPDFLNPNKKSNRKTDLAVVKMRESVPASYSERVPAKLPHSTKCFNMEYIEESQVSFFVAGWGQIGENQNTSTELLGINVKAVDFSICRKTYRQITRSRHLCAYEEGKDACQGDSGGGLFYNDYIWGVVAWGKGCARLDYPGVYARVDSNLDFIRSAMAARSRATNLDPKDPWGLTLIGHLVTWWILIFDALYLLF